MCSVLCAAELEPVTAAEMVTPQHTTHDAGKRPLCAQDNGCLQ